MTILFCKALYLLFLVHYIFIFTFILFLDRDIRNYFFLQMIEINLQFLLYESAFQRLLIRLPDIPFLFILKNDGKTCPRENDWTSSGWWLSVNFLFQGKDQRKYDDIHSDRNLQIIAITFAVYDHISEYDYTDQWYLMSAM